MVSQFGNILPSEAWVVRREEIMISDNGHHAVEVGFANGRAPAASVAAPIFESRMAPVQILVFDDDEHIRKVCRSVAEESGMRVLAAPSQRKHSRCWRFLRSTFY